MRKLSSLTDHDIAWQQVPGLRSEYELRFGDEVVASLKLPRMLGSAAVFQCEEGTWNIARSGFFASTTHVRRADSVDPEGTFRASPWTRGGMLEFADGRVLQLRTKVWGRTLEWYTPSGESLVQMRGSGFWKFRADLHMTRDALQWPELHWLVGLLCYQMIMMRRDSASHAAAH